LSFSLGCSVNLRQGVAAVALPARRSEILLNGKPVEIPAVRQVIDTLSPEPVAIQFETPLKLGFGFGASASCCLSAALAVAQRYGLPHSREQLGMIAHQAEVSNKSGLGDVAAQLCGGVAYRRCLTGPLDCGRVPVEPAKLYYRAFGGLDTSSVLASPQRMETIAESGRKAVEWLRQRMGETAALPLSDLIGRSLVFARETGLVSSREVREAIDEVLAAGGQATMIMLGQGVLATRPGADPSLWTECSIDDQGARWL